MQSPPPYSSQTQSAGVPGGISRNTMIAIAVGGVLVVVLAVIGVLWLAANYPAEIEAVRDIFLVLFSAVACASTVVLVMLLVAVIRLINMLEFEIKPILEKTNETVSTLQTTTEFVGKNVARPVVTARSYMAGLRRGLRVLFGDPKRNLPD